MAMENKKLLKGKTCLITGASGDIGRSVALLFATEGGRVIGTYHKNAEKARSLENLARKMSLDVNIKSLDVANEAEVINFFNELNEKEKRLDVLVNVAGHSDRRVWFAKPEELTAKEWIEVFNTDLIGMFNCCKEAAKIMFRKKIKGSIVNFASAAGVTGHVEGFPYTAAKAGVIAVTKSLAYYFGPKVRINAVAPGNIDAGSIRWYDERTKELLANEASLRRLGSTDEVAKVVLFLASDMSSFVTGQTILVDGGI
jgi:3-oxoacyl-[acyl-carrier protein] reductase